MDDAGLLVREEGVNGSPWQVSWLPDRRWLLDLPRTYVPVVFRPAVRTG